MLTSVCTALSLPAIAQTYTCNFKDLHVDFTIDHNQFVDPTHPKDPPRNKVTQVQAGDAQFTAEPFLMANGTAGFHARDHGSILVVQADGAARYATTNGTPGDPATPPLIGTCEEQ